MDENPRKKVIRFDAHLPQNFRSASTACDRNENEARINPVLYLYIVVVKKPIHHPRMHMHAIFANGSHAFPPGHSPPPPISSERRNRFRATTKLGAGVRNLTGPWG